MSVEVEQPAATITVVGEARGGGNRAAVDRIDTLRTRDGLASRVCVGESVTACCNVCLCCHSNCHLHCIWHLQSMYVFVCLVNDAAAYVCACVVWVLCWRCERASQRFVFFVCVSDCCLCERVSQYLAQFFWVKTNPIRFFG